MRTGAFWTSCSFGCPILQLGLVSFVTLVLANSGFAKMYQEPKSFTVQVKPLDQVNRKVLPKVDVQRLLTEDRRRLERLEPPQPLRFAIPRDAFYTLDNSGTTTKVEGGSLWQLRIRSEGAQSHNLGITKFNMPDGANLWIYDPARKHVEGPYTARHRSHRGSLWTPIIEGDEIIVEVFTPVNVAKPVIEITKVNQGYRDFDKAGIPGAGRAGDCNVDVMCPAGNNWSNQIRAVGVYTANGRVKCTGTMLNNTKRDFTPYFLTANHCRVTTSNDDSVVVYWNYQVLAPACMGAFSHGPGSITDNQTGALWRAANAASDFAILELSSRPDPSFRVFYAGWDATTMPPAATSSNPIAGIHHPWLEVKAINTSNTSPSSTNYLSPTTNPTGDYWRVVWNSGVTEMGSSGSCLFNNSGRCIGQLHAGNPLGCGDPIKYDYYGKFNISWDRSGSAPTNRLRQWLDPTGIITGPVTGIDGIEPPPPSLPPSAPTNVVVQ